MRKTIKTEAIVLKKRSLLNTDNLVTLLTQETGKINVIAKGVKKISSRRLPHLQTTNLINALIYRNKEKAYLQETSLISAFSQIKKDSQKMSYLYFMLLVIDRLLPENQKEHEVYLETKRFLIELSKTLVISSKILEKYLSSILTKLGYLNKSKSLTELHSIIEELTNEKIPLRII